MTRLTPVELDALGRAYWRHVVAEDLGGRGQADLAGAVASHLELAANRPQGTARVRVRTPLVEPDGWSAAGRSVIEVVTDDMPFLVDSVTSELNQADHAIALTVHPQPVVRRDVAGGLLGLADLAAPGAEDTRESWIHVEIARVTADEASAIETGLRRVLSDVRNSVEDWQKMGEAALRAAGDLLGGQADPEAAADPEHGEAADLLCWLADNHFTFLGYREYALENDDRGAALVGVPGSGLGILRGDAPLSFSFDALPPEIRERVWEDPRPVIVNKSTSRSTVHRPAYLDFIGVKRYDDRGRVLGERRFLGLFARSAYSESVLRIPMLRRKVDELFAITGFAPNSYSGRDLIEAVETYPRDELYITPTAQLADTLLAVLHLKERRRLRLFLRRDEFGRFVSALVYLPRDRYDTTNRLRIEEILIEELGGFNIEHSAWVTESVLARLHFVMRVDPDRTAGRQVDTAAIEDRLVAATRTWREDLAEALDERYDPVRATELTARYAEAFPAGYREANSAWAAVDDLTRLERLTGSDDLSVRLYGTEDARRFTVYRRGDAVSLSELLPVLQHLGVDVTDEQPYHIACPGQPAPTWIYDFGLAAPAEAQPTAAVREAFCEAFLAVRRGQAESDGFNRLVLLAGLTWRQVSVLRAYAKYLRQAGTTFGQEYLENVVTAHVPIARMLVRLFEAKFSLDLGAADAADRVEVLTALDTDIATALDEVPSLDADRILRSFLTLIRATTRTNYFAPESTDPRPALAVKLDPKQVPDLPAPRPVFEIWVYSPGVEGVHLRFGPVARGGLRWSDRREDFRTEILGLVKAQMVKNAVIVPVGAKGGFVVKRPPAPTGSADGDRDAQNTEGIACYRSFVGALLDVTDDLRDGTVVPAPHVVRHDADDAYLVVAADKGTAKFSDIANEISTSRHFWLGDAFASGGSVGYDHKVMGITARGAWESVKRHFRERGIDCQSQDFTCVGIGDMSGDVFGNGMLLSRHTRLLAAFDHRHVFLDPDPDPEESFAERTRMFALPRSSWADYDTRLISAGGGVHPRSAKSIPISPQVRAVLGLDKSVIALPPNNLLRAILLAPVDLLWNGGIGTYVKASSETHAEVGDKANDGIRVDGAELRAACVGEGGNLGCTQRGRIEYALAGGRINTDAIDNSAGVDTSDHEVNIKILLDVPGTEAADRAKLLASMTDEVAALVLADNYAQNVALAVAAVQAPALLHVHSRLIRSLERAGLLDRAIEFLPADKEIATRAADGRGLTTPELSVLLAWSKISLYDELLGGDLPDAPALRDVALHYFPSELHDACVHSVGRHPLHREIIATAVVNDLVNDAGITFVHRVREETAAASTEIVRAYLVARDAFDLEAFRAAVSELDTKVEESVLTAMRLAARRLAERATRWLLAKRRPPIDIGAELAAFGAPVREVLELLPKALCGPDAQALTARRDALVDAGVPAGLALRTAGFELAYVALDVVEVSRSHNRSLADTAAVYFLLAEQLEISALRAAVDGLPRDDRWKAMARASLRADLMAAHAALTAEVLEAGGPGSAPAGAFAAWRAEAGDAVDRAGAVLADIAGGAEADLAAASVALRAFRGLLRGTLI
ncbi:MAG TPA: NAD-glutamate dehydrogenase [Sporichthyaceae bacterium]|nr:NAD-glutamate dehydrogenase [Sporichthyaceae bacterium]